MRIVAVTACPTGIAHTYMAAESLNIAAKKLGVDIKVETQGAIGIENELTNKDIEDADLIILAIDKEISKERFENKNVIQISTREAIKDSEKIIDEYIKNIKIDKKNKLNIYPKIMAGINYIVPIMILLSIIPCFKITMLTQIGDYCWNLIYVLFAMSVAIAISDKIAIPVTLIISIYMTIKGGMFISCFVIGLFVGVLTKTLIKYFKKIKVIGGILSISIIPLVSLVVLFCAIQLKVDNLILSIDNNIMRIFIIENVYIKIIITVILSIMMIYDLGGRINKVAYVIAICSIGFGDKSYIMAATMIAGMIPPLSLGLYKILIALIHKNKIDQKYSICFIKGLFFISEGAIELRAEDKSIYLISTIIGVICSSIGVILTNCKISAPHGGILTLLVPKMIDNEIGFLISLSIGILITILTIIILKFIRNSSKNYDK